MFRGAIPSALAAATPHRCGSAAQGTWMVDEWYGVHVRKKLRNGNNAVAGSGFFEHHALILLIGVDFVARLVNRWTSNQDVRSRVNLGFPAIQRRGD